VRDFKLQSKEILTEETHNSCFGHHDTKQDKDVHQYEKKNPICIDTRRTKEGESILNRLEAFLQTSFQLGYFPPLPDKMHSSMFG
jgi:hypothetical protein